MQKKNNFPMVIVIIGVFIVFLIILFSTFGGSGKGGQDGVLQQQTAVQRLADESGQPVDYSIENGVIRHLSFKWSGQAGQSSQAVLSDFLVEFADLFNIEDIEQQLTLIDVSSSSDGGTTYQYDQVYDGLPVYGAQMKFHVSTSGELDWYEGVYIPNLTMDTTGAGSQQQALVAIEAYLDDENLEVINTPELMLYNPQGVGLQDPDNMLLVWYFEIASETTFSGFFVDANRNQVINTLPLLNSAFSYQIYDVKEKWWKFWSKNADPKLVIENGIPQIDEAEIDSEAFILSERLETIYNYYYDNFGWASYDGDDSIIRAHINYREYPLFKTKGAWWYPTEKYLLFTDGMIDNLDIPAHEFTHGVTQSCGGFNILIPNQVSESLALSESFSDIFAAFIDNSHPWQMCYTDCSTSDDLVRDLANPSNSGDPDHYSDLVEPGEASCILDEIQYGCGHPNSTIHSHAVYLFTREIGEQKSSHIVFNAISSGLIHTYADFATARRVIVRTCREMIGDYDIQEGDCEAIEDAYDSVGILDETVTIGPKKEEQSGSVTTVIAPIPQTTTMPQAASLDSETVLVMDISGSMNEDDISGITKMEAAQHASYSLMDVIENEQNIPGGGVNHSVGLVSFSYAAYTETQLTNSIEDVKNLILNLSPDGQTAMADGLQAGIDLFDENSTSEQIIVLLSDGLPNASSMGWFWTQEDYQDEVIELSSQAGDRGICVYTIGFGDPSADKDSEKYIDENFLREVASASKCGDFYVAQDAGQLADVFVELRHASMGSILYEQSGTINQGENLDLGNFSVPGGQSQMLFTLNWPGSQLTAALVDPGGKTVDSDYPGATISSQDTITSVVIESPQGGDWHLQIYGQDVPEGVTTYNTVISTRSAGKGKSTPSWLWVVLGGAVVVIALVASRKPEQAASAGARQSQGPRLVFTSGSLAGKQVKLSKDMLIGRRKECQIQIPADPSVSRKHARIVYANGRWFIQDQNSSAGIYVNGKKERSIRLHSGDVIRLGNTEMKFYSR